MRERPLSGFLERRAAVAVEAFVKNAGWLAFLLPVTP